jgi:hypothetical protein
MEEKRPEGSGAYDWKPLLENEEPPPEEFTNPAGLSQVECDIEPPAEKTEPCDPTEVEDMVLEESFPGYGIPGFEGEEDGGG